MGRGFGHGCGRSAPRATKILGLNFSSLRDSTTGTDACKERAGYFANRTDAYSVLAALCNPCFQTLH
jgi:hypothetical protein